MISKNLRKDRCGIVVTGSLLIGLLIAGAVGIGGIVLINNLTQDPNITYNVSEPSGGLGGLSIGGEGFSITWLLVIGIGLIVAYFLFFRGPRTMYVPKLKR